MQITVNGQPRQLNEVATIAQLLDLLDLRRPQVAVEVNGELVPREQHANHRFREGDQVEIVTLVGGG